ncbi:MAG: YbaK/EbsC family protein [Planktomarina sp.]
MSKSLKRVKATIEKLELDCEVLETGQAKTAQQAADEMSCHVDQIAKSIIMAGDVTGSLYLFITAGGQSVDPCRAATLAGETLGKADATAIRSITGFAIGGVSPLGHLTPITSYLDRTLLQFDHVYAAAGTPHHVFRIDPNALPSAAQAQVADFIR